MITSLFNRIKKRRKQKAKEKRKLKRLKAREEKRRNWSDRWQNADFMAGWEAADFPAFIQSMIDEGVLSTGSSLLDIGCGSGFLASEFVKRGFKVTAFDFAPEAIEKATEKYPENDMLTFTVADATKALPFSGTFDIGFDRATLHTLPMKDRKLYAKYLADAINPGGTVVIIFADRFASKLPEAKESGLLPALEQHMNDVFQQYFDLVSVSGMGLEGYFGDGRDGLLVILHKKVEE